MVCQIETAERLSVSGAGEAPSEGETTRAFNSTILDGNLQAAVRHLTVREGGGVMAPNDIYTKAGIPVLEVLQSKHPDRRVPDLDSTDNLAFEGYPWVPEPVPVQ